MAKVTVKVDTSALSKRIKDIQTKAASRELLAEIGETVVRMNAKNARTGKASDGSSFPPLSQKWKQQRGELAKVNDTHLAYGQGRSNVTFTGQLIDGLMYEIDERTKTVTVKFNNEVRVPYKNMDGSRRKESVRNSEIAQFLTEKGWKLVGINKEMNDRILFLIEAAIRQVLNK